MAMGKTSAEGNRSSMSVVIANIYYELCEEYIVIKRNYTNVTRKKCEEMSTITFLNSYHHV